MTRFFCAKFRDSIGISARYISRFIVWTRWNSFIPCLNIATISMKYRNTIAIMPQYIANLSRFFTLKNMLLGVHTYTDWYLGTHHGVHSSDSGKKWNTYKIQILFCYKIHLFYMYKIDIKYCIHIQVFNTCIKYV